MLKLVYKPHRTRTLYANYQVVSELELYIMLVLLYAQSVKGLNAKCLHYYT